MIGGIFMIYNKKISKVGTSLWVLIPYDVTKFLKLQEDDDVTLEIIDDSIVIKKVQNEQD